MISGCTRLIGIVGHPVAQVKMPTVMNAWFERHQADLALLPFDVPPEALVHYAALLRGARNMVGSIVTVPHKRAALRLVDRLSLRSQALGAINVIRRDADGLLHGDHLDGFGFLNAARAHGFAASGKWAYLVGIGGAGSALAYTFCEAGIRQLFLGDIDRARVGELKALLRRDFPDVALPDSCDDLSGYDLVANATALGMRPDDPLPIARDLLDTLDGSTLVAELVTLPVMTPLLQHAKKRGCEIQTGAEMAEASMAFIGGFLGVMPEIDPEATVFAPI